MPCARHGGRRGEQKPRETAGVLGAPRRRRSRSSRARSSASIGRNGAGKSTLLKILVAHHRSRPPGAVALRGRVGSLLEVGTGFHPELTGRENIFLNGAILGMTRREIGRKFDEIVEFAEVERFLDTPVKRYSSGMYVRLAFAVAAHLEPEILLVDEVLAVGDAEFQQKCLGKMRDVASHGRTVLFVSHNLGAVRRLCERAVLLDRGPARLRGRAGRCDRGVHEPRPARAGSMGARSFATDIRAWDRRGAALRTGADRRVGGPLDALHLEQPFRITAVFDVAESDRRRHRRVRYYEPGRGANRDGAEHRSGGPLLRSHPDGRRSRPTSRRRCCPASSRLTLGFTTAAA